MFVLRTVSLKKRVQAELCIGLQRLMLCFVELSRLFCGMGAILKIGRSS